jgi:hypothetical protein
MKYLFCFFFILSSFVIFSQEKFSKEVSFITENDLYVSTQRDRYYTNGMFLNYRYLTKTENPKLEKKIFEFQVGHEMYTPYKAGVNSIDEHDRPFAAYFYGSFGVNRIYKKNRIFNTSVQLGVIGSKAYGKELQEVIHELYGFREVTGWQFQIKNAFAINLSTEYVHHIATNKTNDLDISWVNSARLGTVYTDVSTGFYSRIGTIPLTKIINSIAFNTNLNDDTTDFTREVETFFFIKPMVRYAVYDATLQGSFLATDSQVTKELIPIVFDLEVGFRFTANRFNFGYVFNYNTSKSEGLRYTYGNKFGSISVQYLIR